MSTSCNLKIWFEWVICSKTLTPVMTVEALDHNVFVSPYVLLSHGGPKAHNSGLWSLCSSCSSWLCLLCVSCISEGT